MLFRSKRDWFDRWLSALKHFLISHKTLNNNTPIVEWEHIDNQFIYDTFDTEFANKLYSGIDKYEIELHDRLLKDFVRDDLYSIIGIFKSQNYYKINNKCTYEFDIKDLNSLEKFIKKEFNVDIKIDKTNEGMTTKSKIVVDDNLKQWVWDKFEKPFIKGENLI